MKKEHFVIMSRRRDHQEREEDNQQHLLSLGEYWILQTFFEQAFFINCTTLLGVHTMEAVDPNSSSINQFHLHHMSSFCDCRFTLILLAHRIEHTVGYNFWLTVPVKLSIVLLMKQKMSAKVFANIKAAPKHVDEIDPRCQFYQHFRSWLLVLKCLAQLFSTCNF